MNDGETPPNKKGGDPPDSTTIWQRTLRDVVIVATGVFLLVNEALSSLERPILITAAIGCFGLPFALRADERRK